MLPPWRIPAVRAFALGRTAALIGWQCLAVAVGWQLYEKTGSAWALGLVGLFEILPVLGLMTAAGHVADRFPRRNVAVLAHLGWTAAALGLAAVAFWDGPIAAIYGLLVVAGTSRAFGSPAVSSLLPELLLPEQFMKANAWLASSFEVALISGPAIGGLLITLGGNGVWAYAAAALGQLVFVALLLTLPAKPRSRESMGETERDLLAGWRFIRSQPIFLAAITLDLFAVLLGGAVALLPIFAKDILEVGPVGLGWLRAAPSAGALITALTLTRLPPWKKPGVVLIAAVAGFGLATVAFGLSRSLPLSLACLFLVGATDEVSVVIRWTLEQLLTPDELRGRVSAVHYVFIGLSNELGYFESGVAAALLGPVVAVAGGGIAALGIVALVAWKWPELRRLRPLDSIKPVAG